MSDTTHVTVRILDKEFQVACPEEERAALMESADYLHRMMTDIRASGRVVGMDRIAVMAALNMANELLQEQNETETFTRTVGDRIRFLHEKLDNALAENEEASD